MKNLKIKKSVLKTYIEQNTTVFTAIGIILVIILWGLFTICLGKLVPSSEIENTGIYNLFEKGVIWLFFGILIEMLGIFCLSFIAFVIFNIANALVTFIRKQKAIHNYLYLPLTTDEIKKAVERNEFSLNVMSYLDYIDCNLTYYGINKKDSHSIYFNINDMFKLMYSIKDVFNIDNIDIVWFDEEYDMCFDFISDFFEYYISSKSEILDEMSLNYFMETFYCPKVVLTLTDDNTIIAKVSFMKDDKTVNEDTIVINLR